MSVEVLSGPLPEGWERKELGNIAETQLGKMLNSSKQTGLALKPYLRNINLQWGRIDLSDVKEMDIFDNEMKQFMETLHKAGVVPALSCGMHPGLVNALRKSIGNDWMANCGGGIHGHPSGTFAGARAMRQAIDGTGGEEYEEAVKKWGFVENI